MTRVAVAVLLGLASGALAFAPPPHFSARTATSSATSSRRRAACLASAPTPPLFDGEPPLSDVVAADAITGTTARLSSLPHTVLPAAAATLAMGTLVLLPSGAAAVTEALDAAPSDVVGDGFLQAFSLIFISELGDKTFFIAALLAAKFSRVISFAGSLGALAVMTLISVVLGQVFHAVPSSLANGLPFDDYIASAAFAYFGYRTLKEAIELDDTDKGGELLDAEEALQDIDEDGQSKRGSTWALVGQTFSLVFAAEFGDRSFLSTIALAAAQNPVSVASGALAAHSIATVIAILGGSLLSKYISEKVIGYIGGSLFIVFSLTTLVGFF